MNIELTDEEFETLKDIFSDHGSDCPYTNSSDFQALGEKLKVLEPVPEPTEEELKRREEFRNAMGKLFSQTNLFIKKMIEDLVKDNTFMSGEQWGDKVKIGSQLRIRLPKDYI